MQNLEITCHLKSPMIETPPFFDSLLGWVLGIEIGSFCHRGMKKIDFVNKLPIPLEKEVFDNSSDQIEGGWFYKCSNPIYNIEYEWVERWAKRFDVDKIINFSEKHLKSVSISSGRYKNYHVSMHCKQINKIKWFARGDKLEIERLLDKIKAVGNKRSIGYGFVYFWEVKQIEEDYSIVYDLCGQGKMLMKTVPVKYLNNIDDLALQNLRREYGRYKLPYWYPAKEEVVIPC